MTSIGYASAVKPNSYKGEKGRSGMIGHTSASSRGETGIFRLATMSSFAETSFSTRRPAAGSMTLAAVCLVLAALCLAGPAAVLAENSAPVPVANDYTVDEGGTLSPANVKPSPEVARLLGDNTDESDFFGYSVAIDGGCAVVGAQSAFGAGNYHGAAYVYYRDQDGADCWGQVKRLGGDANSIAFGRSAAISGDYIVVGDYADTSGTGAAFVFSRNQGGGDNWGQVARLTASDGTWMDQFGCSAAISGDYVVIGADGDDDDTGSAYVFYKDEGGPGLWGQIKKLTASDGAGGDYFGTSVSISGDYIVIGAMGDDNLSGSAYVFYKDQGGAGNWGQAAKLTAPDAAADDQFGGSVSIDGAYIISGAPYDDDYGTNSGSAYVFYRDEGGTGNWGQVAKLTAADAAEADYFGGSVSIDGDYVVAGARTDDDFGQYSGAAYLFYRHQGGVADSWGQAEKITAADAAEGDRFGCSVSISGLEVVSGAYYKDSVADHAGKTYVFEIKPDCLLYDDTDPDGDALTAAAASQPSHGSLTVNADGTFTYVHDGSETTSDSFTYTASDGSLTSGPVTVGITVNPVNAPPAAEADTCTVDEGGIREYDALGATVEVAVTFMNEPVPQDYFGHSVSVSGDYAVVGMHNGEDNGYFSGSAFILARDQGGEDNWGQVTKLLPDDGDALDRFGWSVSISGDYAVVGSAWNEIGGVDTGTVYVYYRNQGGGDHWGQALKLVGDDSDHGDSFGYSVAISGDYILVGAIYDDDGGTNAGAAYVFYKDHGGAGAWGQVGKVRASDAAANGEFGSVVDIEGGRAIVGAVDSAYVFQQMHNEPGAWRQMARLVSSDFESGDGFGSSVSISGGRAVVGATGDDDGGTNAGSAYVFHQDQGGADNWGQAAKLTAPDAAASDAFGCAVAVDGDYAVVGADNAYGNHPTSGKAYVFCYNQDGEGAWGHVSTLLGSEPQPELTGSLGTSVAIDGLDFVVGAPAPGVSYAGGMYVFALGEGGILLANDTDTEDGLLCAGIAAQAQHGWVDMRADGTFTYYHDDGEDTADSFTYVTGDGQDNSAPATVTVTVNPVNEPPAGLSDSYAVDEGGTLAPAETTLGAAASLTASDYAASDYFGCSVDIDGGFAVAGARYDDDNGSASGSAYVFYKDQDSPGRWGQAAKLLPDDGEADDKFGDVVAVSGDYALVGVHSDKDAGTNTGSAYLFYKDQGGADNWGQMTKFTAPTPAEYDAFGVSVDIDGPIAVVGASGVDGNNGAVFIYHRLQGGEDGWGLMATLTDPEALERVGRQVAVDGDYVAASGDSGIHLYHRVGGAWEQVAVLAAEDGMSNGFGTTSVDIDGDYVVVGAPTDDDAGTDAGAAYVFYRHQGGADNWGQAAKLTASDAAAEDWFGYAVAVTGDYLVAGAYGDDDGGNVSGSAYVFQRGETPGDWTLLEKRTAPSAEATDYFGHAVAADSTGLIIGAHGRDIYDATNAGRAYVADLRSPSLLANDGDPESNSTAAVASQPAHGSVTVNSDGTFSYVHDGSETIFDSFTYTAGDGEFTTEAVTVNITVNPVADPPTPVDDAFTVAEGGTEEQLRFLPADELAGLEADTPVANQQFGRSVAVDGDWAIVGTEYAGVVGAAYVYYRDQGGEDNWGRVTKLIPTDYGNGDYFGCYVGISGDYAVVGAYQEDPGGVSNAGSAYVFKKDEGGTNNWGQVAKLTEATPAANDYFGFSVAISGEYAVVGAYGDDDGGSAAGAAYVFYKNQGGEDNWGQVAKLMSGVYGYFGTTVAIDGRRLAVGAGWENSRRGAAYVFDMDEGGDWYQVARLAASDGASNDELGYYGLAVSGDYVVAGARYANGGTTLSGAAYIFHQDQGGPGNWGQVKKLTPPSPAGNGLFGWSVSMSGGLVAVGGQKDSTVAYNVGAAHVYFKDQGGTGNWGLADSIAGSDAASGDLFGYAVALDGLTLIAGASMHHTNSVSDSGKAYAFKVNYSGVLANDIYPEDAVFSSSLAGYPLHGTVTMGSDGAFTYVHDGSETMSDRFTYTATDGQTVGGPATVAVTVTPVNDTPAAAQDSYTVLEGGTLSPALQLSADEMAALAAGDAAAGDGLGYAVSLDGGTAVIGAPDDDTGAGAAYVYYRDQGGDDTWGQVVKLTAGVTAENDGFGCAVAISGDYAVVGASGDDTGGDGAGAAYVFYRDQGGDDTWGQADTLTADDAAAGDLFGLSVSLDEGFAVIGAPGDDDGGDASGSAYVFHKNQGGLGAWGQVTKLAAGSPAAGDGFGCAVSVSGYRVAVGASGDDGGGLEAGTAYVFHKDEGGTDSWGQAAELVPTDAGAGDAFGCAVSVSGQYAVVGASGEDAGGDGAGAAYLFGEDQGGEDSWGQVKKLTAADAAAGDGFGCAVSIDGPLAAIGASGDDDGAGGTGSVYAFYEDQGGDGAWGQRDKLTADAAAADDGLGCAVSMDGVDILAGASGADTGGLGDSGAACVFQLKSGSLSFNDTDAEGAALTAAVATQPGNGTVTVNEDGTFTYEHDGSETLSDSFTYTVSDGGVSGTGTVNITITPVNAAPTPSDDSYTVAEGGTLQPPQRLPCAELAELAANDATSGDEYGWSVSIDGDWAIVGAYKEEDGGTDAGAAYIYHRNQGGADSWGQVKKLVSSDLQAYDAFGYSVAISGEYAVVGAMNNDGDGINNGGAAYVFQRNQGGENNWGQTARLVSDDVANYDTFGSSVAIDGDYLAVGATGAGTAGAAYVFQRSGSAWEQVAKLLPSDGASGDGFGLPVAISGDYVVAAAAYKDPSGISNAGAAYVYYRNQGGVDDSWGQAAVLSNPDPTASDWFGKSVSISGDYAVVGANYDDPGAISQAGAAYVFYRNQGGVDDSWGQALVLTASDAAAGDYFG